MNNPLPRAARLARETRPARRLLPDDVSSRSRRARFWLRRRVRRRVADRHGHPGLLEPPGQVAAGRLAGEWRTMLPPEMRRRRQGHRRRVPGPADEPSIRCSRSASSSTKPYERIPAGARGEGTTLELRAPGHSRAGSAVRTVPTSSGGCGNASSSRRVVRRARLIVADEPTTALDVSIQAQVLALLRKLCGEKGTAMLSPHDMGVIAETADRVAVMYAGRIVEITGRVIRAPVHPYARTDGRDSDARPVAGPLARIDARAHLNARPSGVPITRCPDVLARCRSEMQHLEAHGTQRRVLAGAGQGCPVPRSPRAKSQLR